jgi:hypothetical protein
MSDIKLDIVSDLSALRTSGLITEDIVSSLGLSIAVLNTSGILSDIVLSEHTIINSDKLSESSACVKSGILLGNVELSSINPKKGETSFCDSNTSTNAQQSSAGGVIGIGSHGAKSRPAISFKLQPLDRSVATEWSDGIYRQCCQGETYVSTYVTSTQVKQSLQVVTLTQDKPRAHFMELVQVVY